MEKIFLDSENGRVCANVSDAGRCAVVIAHGYLSDKNSRTNQALAKLLNLAGISSISFDVYGHGESEGNVERLTVSKAVSSMLAAYDYAASRFDKIGMCGSSFTGSVTLISASKRKPEAIALKCPVFMPKELWDFRHGEKGILDWKKKGYVETWGSRWHYEAYEDAKGYDMKKIAAKVKAPTLVVHGDKDVTVPISQAENLVFSLGSAEKRLLEIKGADHFFKDERSFSLMAESISGWFSGHLA
jgi:pimeloyl-ACP methyl ester carboxylesterase